MKTMTYEYIIIGSGAGGSAAAYRLALAGKRVLLVEKGKALPTDGSTLDFNQVISKGAFKSRELWLDRKGRRFAPEEYFNLGGKTKWYGAALLRYAREEFEADPEFQCLPWPFPYEELEPYYIEAERVLGVRCFEIEADLRAIKRRLDGKGWRGESLPLALSPEILADEHEARHFDGFASALGFKGEGQSAFLSRVASADNLSILTGQPVRELLGSERVAGRIAGVRLADGQALFGGKVLLAAGALHSPRLLQRYLDAAVPTLPCARLVGRYFKRHILTALLAVSPSSKTDALRKTAIWFNGKYPHGSIQPLGFGGDVLASLLPGFIPRRVARRFGERAYGFFLQTEDGSDERNRVVAEGGHDMQPIPRLDYDLQRLPAAAAEHRHMVGAFRRALFAAGYLSFVRTIPLAGTAHACGTLVTGRDPARSVVDPFGKVHGLENLYVVDGSVLPRMSRVNPSLTIYAWALRVADHLIQGRN
jgi:choline dehydrogenase-like flavoprotein